MASILARTQVPVASTRTSRKSFAVGKRCSVISYAEIPEEVTAEPKSAGILRDAPDAPQSIKGKGPWTQPTLNADTPSPIFGGSTGGLLRKAQVEEFYVCTWEAKKEQIFEMPTGGAAIMRKGPNLLKLARKEQALALTSQLKNKFKLEPCFYRVFPDGKVQYLHPADGVYPEKVNAGRQLVNVNMRRIGQNVNPIQTKFTGKGPAMI